MQELKRVGRARQDLEAALIAYKARDAQTVSNYILYHLFIILFILFYFIFFPIRPLIDVLPYQRIVHLWIIFAHG